MRELEIAGLAAVDTLAGPVLAPAGAGPKHASVHAECLNCAQTLHGRYCSRCGQTADDHHRSILHLAWEAVESLTHLDGRLACTLPALLVRPGRLARDHMEGRRARHVPLFRLFLITLLLFMVSLESVLHAPSGRGLSMTIEEHGVRTVVPSPSSDQLARVIRGEETGDQLTAELKAQAAGRRAPAVFASAPRSSSTTLRAGSEGRAARWFDDRVDKVRENPEYYKLLVFTWAHRLAVLLLPIFAAQLTLLYAYRRKFYVYDHLVVSMQFLSFVFLVSAVAWALPGAVRDRAVRVAALWTPVNLFMLLRGAYGSSVAGALLKTLLLWSSTLLVFGMLIVGLLALALQQL